MRLTNAELEQADDLDLGASSWLKLDQERIDRFADVTEDHQWIHVDVERAAASPVGSTIAHGYLVLSVIPKLLAELLDLPEIGSMINYGLDKLRFLYPVPAGSEVRLKCRLASCQKKPNGYLLRFRGDVEIREGGKRALIMENLLLVQPQA